MRYPLLIGNWKLHGNKNMVTHFMTTLRNKMNPHIHCNIAIAPPIVYLDLSSKYLLGSSITLGAQNVDINLSGAFTGEISAAMLKDIGVKYVIIGHSERRNYHQESETDIAKKFFVLKSIGLIPVLCIGESEIEKQRNQTKTVCARQLDIILNRIGENAFENTVIAYEPIWAIGTGKCLEPNKVQEIHKFIREYISQHNSKILEKVLIQYGGSVNITNAPELFSQPDIDGALVGKASLQIDHFLHLADMLAEKKNHRLYDHDS